MLRAEESTRRKRGSDQRERIAADPGAAGDARDTGRLVARCGIDAINATERAICGSGAVHRPAVAEGMALAGKRAATLLDETDSPAPPGRVPAAWVHHRLRPGQPGSGGETAFELVAGSPQEAIDHCLVAHRAAASIGFPGSCSVDRATVAGPHLVRLPAEATIDACLEPATRSRVSGPAGESDCTPQAVADAVEAAFDHVRSVTGRPGAAVTSYRMQDAECALVASGGTRRRSLALADALREAGVACGVVSVALVRPFPRDEVSQALGSVRRIAVPVPPSDPTERDHFPARVRGALEKKRSVVLTAVELGTDCRLPAGLDQALGLSVEQLRTAGEHAGSAERDSHRVALGVAPAGGWGEQFLLDAAALLGTLGRFELHCPDVGSSAVTMLELGQGAAAVRSSNELDLLFLADASLLGLDGGLLDAVRDGGTVVFRARADSPLAASGLFGEARLQEIASRGIHLTWLGDESGDAGALPPADARTRLLGAFLAADEALARLVRSSDLIGALCGTDEVADRGARTAELLQRGAQALQTLEPAAIDPAGLHREADLRPRRALPLMPNAPEVLDQPGAEGSAGDTMDDWSVRLHRFHLSGEGAHSPAEPLPALPLRPAGLAPLAAPKLMYGHYPLVLLPDGGATSFAELTAGIVETIEAGGAKVEILREHGLRLARTVSRLLDQPGPALPFEQLIEQACEMFAGEFELSESAAEELKAELETFRRHLPQTAELVELNEGTLLRFHSAALAHERGPLRFDFMQDVKKLIVRLEELLQIEHSFTPEGSSPEALAATLGGGAGARIDSGELSRNLARRRGSKPMDPERKLRVEATVASLREWVDGAAAEPECIVVHPDLLPGGQFLPAARIVNHPEGLEAALGLFDGAAERTAAIVHAVRIARLEIRNAYDPEQHDAMLRRFDWQAMSREEMLLIPPVVVVETGERLRGRSLNAFSALLLSGRPIQVLVLEPISPAPAGDTWEALSGYHPGLGYIAVAHREAMVLQATLAHPAQLLDGLGKMATALGPAAALVSVPSWSAPFPPWLQLAAYHFGRGGSLFRYDPAAGETWAERVDLSENPQPELAWPTPRVRGVDESGGEIVLDEPFTFAHAAALDPVYRPHFRVIPTAAWNANQVTAAAYLALPREERMRRVPFIWVVDGEGVLARAVMTREMAYACRDHARAWRILQELGGTDNEYARRAADAARTEALTEAGEERARLEAEHAEAMEQAVRAAASDAMERLVAVLMSEDALSALSSGAPVSAPPPATPVDAAPAAPDAEAEAAPAEPAVDEDEEAVSFNEPYIDSMLCTTCNECTNLNPRMFQYNANRQATVADAGAGTFEELVKAAEKCPARCIHPGAPRDDDATATDELVARAAKFN
jgi:ferredoxin